MPVHNTLRHTMRTVMYFFSPLAGFPSRFRTVTAALALTLALTGCATVPPPNDAMNLAQNQVQASMADRKFADAASLAEESSADAELASAKAKLGAARAQIQSKLQENTRLRQEGEQLAARQQQMEQAAPAPAPESSTAAPVQDMPAPSASVLSAPDDTQPASSASTQGGQP